MCEEGVAGLAGVGIVGQQCNDVAPVAADGVVGEVAAREVALDLVYHVLCFGFAAGGQTSCGDVEGFVGTAAGAGGEVAHHVVAGKGAAVGVERLAALVGHHGGQTAALEVAGVVASLAEEQQPPRRGAGGVFVEPPQERAYGYGVLLARGELVVDALIVDHEGGDAVEEFVERRQALRLRHKARVRYDDELGAAAAVEVLRRYVLHGVGDEEVAVVEEHVAACLGGAVAPGAVLQRQFAFAPRRGDLPDACPGRQRGGLVACRAAQVPVVADDALAAGELQGRQRGELYVVEVAGGGALGGVVGDGDGVLRAVGKMADGEFVVGVAAADGALGAPGAAADGEGGGGGGEVGEGHAEGDGAGAGGVGDADGHAAGGEGGGEFLTHPALS